MNNYDIITCLKKELDSLTEQNDFLLRENELLDLVLNQENFSVVAFEQGRVELPKPAIVQRICAVKHNCIGLQL